MDEQECGIKLILLLLLLAFVLAAFRTWLQGN